MTKSSPTPRTPDRRHRRSANPAHRTPTRPGPEVTSAPLPAHDRPSQGGDAASDDRLARSLAVNAGRSALSRHRERITAIENEEDGVPEDEDGMEEAAQAEIDADDAGPGRRGRTP